MYKLPLLPVLASTSVPYKTHLCSVPSIINQGGKKGRKSAHRARALCANNYDPSKNKQKNAKVLYCNKNLALTTEDRRRRRRRHHRVHYDVSLLVRVHTSLPATTPNHRPRTGAAIHEEDDVGLGTIVMPLAMTPWVPDTDAVADAEDADAESVADADAASDVVATVLKLRPETIALAWLGLTVVVLAEALLLLPESDVLLLLGGEDEPESEEPLLPLERTSVEIMSI